MIVKKGKLFNSRHMEKNWPEEITEIRKALKVTNKVRISVHGDERMEERNITELDIFMAIMEGQIIEGFDIGQYPGYNNSEPQRTIAAKRNNGVIIISIGIRKNHYKIITVYQVSIEDTSNKRILSRLKEVGLLDKWFPKTPELNQEIVKSLSEITEIGRISVRKVTFVSGETLEEKFLPYIKMNGQMVAFKDISTESGFVEFDDKTSAQKYAIEQKKLLQEELSV